MANEHVNENERMHLLFLRKESMALRLGKFLSGDLLQPAKSGPLEGGTGLGGPSFLFLFRSHRPTTEGSHTLEVIKDTISA